MSKHSTDPNTVIDKKSVADRYMLSVRTIDNLLVAGMPHLKIGKRRCRFTVGEVDAWMKEQFHTVHRRPALSKIQKKK